jgi:Holliday junction resolvase-like predicted endonuclease
MINKLHYLIGYFGELLTLIYLKLKWYNVIKHRYRYRLGEVDLIVSKKKRIDNCLAFLKVSMSGTSAKTATADSSPIPGIVNRS